MTRKIKEGEWVRPVMTGYLMECCRCGLVHKMDFRVSADGGIEMRGDTVPDPNARPDYDMPEKWKSAR
jgi:hypothetical protein